MNANEVLVRVRACALNHLDLWVRNGLPGLKFAMPHILGSDIAGEIVRVGDLCERVKPGQRVLLADMHAVGEDFRIGRMLSRHTGGAAYILSRPAAQMLLKEQRFDLPVDHLLFNPNNSKLFARLKPWQLSPAIARQQEFVGEKSDIEQTRKNLRSFGATYIRRELVRFGYDLKLIPRQVAALLAGAKFVAMKTAP